LEANLAYCHLHGLSAGCDMYAKRLRELERLVDEAQPVVALGFVMDVNKF